MCKIRWGIYEWEEEDYYGAEEVDAEIEEEE